MNILTVDVEDYFQVENFRKHISYEDWSLYECRVVENTRLILRILNRYETKATFFVLGWIAERYPELVKEIHSQGHEIACHGYSHTLICEQTPQGFRHDLRKATEILKGIVSEPILGYRAPSFSITKDTLWALDIIAEAGFKYDASIFPAKVHSRYGIENAKAVIHKLPGGLYEIPPTTISFLGKRWPAGGGGYFRLYPYRLTEYIIGCINGLENRPAVVYLHPWELDPSQPRVAAADALSRFRHYVNIDGNISKLERLLLNFKFTSISGYMETETFERVMEHG